MATKKASKKRRPRKPDEKWLPVAVPFYKRAYEVSDFGRVRSVPRTVRFRHPRSDEWHRRHIKGVVLKPETDRGGYKCVVLSHHSKRKTFRVHELVLLSFHGPKPSPQHEARHYPDQRRWNNRADNLSWATRKQNATDRDENGTGTKGERHPLSKLEDDQVRRMLRQHDRDPEKYSEDRLARIYKVSSATIHKILIGETWQHIDRPKGRFRCERCNLKFWEEDLRDIAEGQWCFKCNIRWYAVACHPLAIEETVLRNIKRRAKIDGIDEFKQGFVPKVIAERLSKTTWRVWRDEEARKEGWKIPEGENRREVLQELGLLGFCTAETEEQARDYSRRKWPNDFNRVVELQHEGGKPRLQAVPKFPGYFIVRCEYTKRVHDLIHKTKDVLGILPVMLNPYSGFKHPRKEPRQRRKPEQWELEVVAEWSPTPFDNREEVEKLLEEKTALKNTPRRIDWKFPVGSKVKIINGQWQGIETVVDGVSLENPPKVLVKFEVFGKEVKTKLEAWQVMKLED